MMSTITHDDVQTAGKKQILETGKGRTATFTKTYRVFFVDDENMVLKMLSRHFSAFDNFEIATFNSGEACLQNLNQKPDIVVLDYMMSENGRDALDGLDVLKKIKAVMPEVQVIILSGQADVQVAVNCLKKGAVNYIVKDHVMQFNTQNAIESIVKSIELKDEIHSLSNTIKRDKLLIRGYTFIVVALVCVLCYFWMT